MFKRTRRKIIAAVLAVSIVFLIVFLFVIYGTSYYQMTTRDRQMLAQYSEQFFDGGAPPDRGMPPESDGFRPEDEAQRPPGERTMYAASTFYAVMFDGGAESGRVADRGNIQAYDEASLLSLAQQVRDSGKTEGAVGNLAFLVTQKEAGVLVVFLDNTVMHENMITLLQQTLIVGVAAIGVIVPASFFAARRIVRPLEESHQKQKQFVSDAGHELKTPVSVVSANVELLRRQIGENEWLANIRYENERMGALIKDLLALSSAESGQLSTERIDLSKLATGEALPFESVAFERGLTVETDAVSPVPVEGNPSRLRQLVSILLDNAISHSAGGAAVELSVEAERRTAVLTVTNSGEAIPSEDMAHLFERFYRVDKARSEGDHYGLGLAIAKAIVDAHKGTIRVCCENGKVIFTVTLPLTKN